MKVGFVGLGNIGGPMAMCFARSKYDFTVHDLNEAAAKPHRDVGAKWAGSKEDLARAVDVVFLSLPGPKHVEAVIFGSDGLSHYLRPGSIIVDLSTNAPDIVRNIAARLEPKNIGFAAAQV